jgi:chorismate mutase/prephenate dehydrogenase
MTIEDLRTALAEVDQDIIRLAARRQELARAVGQLKDQETRSLRDFAQERRVHERARKVAEGVGLAPEVASALLSILIESSLATQEKQRVVAQGGGSGQRALVIGGAGRMGQWFSRFLASQGFEVEIADPEPSAGEFPHRSDWRQGSLDHDLIVVAAQLRLTAEILSALVELRPPGVVFDIGSL